jgi:hypothetical protein
MNATEIGQKELVGWREKTADLVAPRVSKRTTLDEDQVRAIVGAAFFGLAVYYVVSTVVRTTSAARS